MTIDTFLLQMRRVAREFAYSTLGRRKVFETEVAALITEACASQGGNATAYHLIAQAEIDRANELIQRGSLP